MAERLQKLIAGAGLMSRRAAEEAIAVGRVTVNGRPALPGDRAEPGDCIMLDGKVIPKRETKQVYMLNKPRGYVCSLHDEKGRKSVRMLLPKSAGHVYPVGRLDIMSEGLLLMTNDGDFAQHCTHPSYRVMKTYRTTVSAGTPEALSSGINRLHSPFLLDGVTVRAAGVKLLHEGQGTAVLEITVGEGRNREIRRMCDEAGLHVERLIRISVGKLGLGDLPTGKSRLLTETEIVLALGEHVE